MNVNHAINDAVVPDSHMGKILELCDRTFASYNNVEQIGRSSFFVVYLWHFYTGSIHLSLSSLEKVVDT